VRPPQVGTLSTNLIVGSITAEKMLHAWMINIIVLLKGALVTSNEVDSFLVSTMKGLGVNLAALLRETLYLL